MTRRPPNRAGAMRNWQPGDGARCAYADKAPALLKCGPPVKALVQTIVAAGRVDFEKTVPLCANHSQDGWAPSDIIATARRLATEQLIADHLAEFEDNVRKAVSRLLDTQPSKGRSEN